MDKKVKILITNSEFIIANTGKPFTDKGVRSICASHLSEKSKDGNIYTTNETGKNLLDVIKNEVLSVYRANINRLEEDLNQEKEISLDYAGRFLWELLQNADDSMYENNDEQEMYIGQKGIGFKSVLEITDNPKIFSGKYSFEFSKEKTRQAILQDSEIKVRIEETTKQKLYTPGLHFRIPHIIIENNIPDIIKKLRNEENYTTVIVLPFKNDNIRNLVIDRCKSLQGFFLLFLHNIEFLEIYCEVDNAKFEKKFRVLKESYTSSSSQINEEYILLENSQFQQFLKFTKEFEINEQKGNVAIAVAVDDNDRPILLNNGTSKLFVFFPTEERLNFGFFLHATFNLEQNRNHIRKDEVYEKIIEELKFLLRYVIEKFKNYSKELISIIIPQDKPTPNLERFVNDIIEEFKKTECIPIIGSDKFYSIEKVKFWEGQLGTFLERAEETNSIKDINELERFKLVTSEVNSLKNKLKNIQNLNINILNKCKIDFIKAFNLIITRDIEFIKNLIALWLKLCNQCEEEEIFEKLKQSCIWLTKDENIRTLDETKLLFLEEIKGINFEDWLEFDVLESEIKEFFNKNNEWDKVRDKIREYIISSSNYSIIKNKILNFLKNNNKIWWEKYGYKCLLDLKKLHSKSKFNKEAGKIIYVPTEEGWKLAFYVYVSQEWGVPKEFADFWRGINNRYVLLKPEKWKIDINSDEWRDFLESIGVSWCPKVFEIENGYLITNNEEYNVRNLKEWRKYWDEADKKGIGREKRDKKNYYIDHFPDCVKDLNTEDLIEIIYNLLKLERTLDLKLAYKSYHQYQNFTFANYQLNYMSWIKFDKKFELYPDKESFSPNECFLDVDESLAKFKDDIPILNLQYINDLEKRGEYIGYLRELNFKTSLTNYESRNENLVEFWKDLLERLKNYQINDTNKVKVFYKEFCKFIEFLRNNYKYIFDKLYLLDILTLNGSFQKATEVYYIDDNRFDDEQLIEQLIKEGIYIFILKLKDAERLKEVLGIKPLSRSLEEPEVKYDENKAKCLNENIKDFHLKGIEIFLKEGAQVFYNKEILKKLKEKKIKIYEVNSLVVEATINKKTFSFTPQYYYKENNLYVTEEKYLPRALAYILTPEKPSHADNFEKIISCKNEKDLCEYLQWQKIPEDYLREIDIYQESDEIKNVEKQEESISPLIEKISTNDKNSKQLKSESKEIKNIPSINNKQFKKSNEVASSKRGQKPREAGERAEKFVRNKLKELFGNEWNISEAPENINGKEIDIKITHSERDTYYIEVKSIETIPAKIYWTENEVDLAKEKGDKYILALVDKEQNIYWIPNPIKNLKNAQISGQWKWSGKEEMHKGEITPWEKPSNPPKREADNFSFVVIINNPEKFSKNINEIIQNHF